MKSFKWWQLRACYGVFSAVAMLPFGAHAKDIFVAQVAPFGGPLAVSGRDFNLGALIAFDEVNASGGVAGNRLRLVSRDDGYRSAETVRLVSELVDKSGPTTPTTPTTPNAPIALIGMWGAENIEAVVAKNLLVTSGIPVVGVRSGVAALRGNPSLFHVRGSYKDEIQRIAGQLQTIGSNRVAVIYEDNGFGREALADAQAALLKNGLKPVAVAAQAPNDLKVDAAVNAIVAAQPQALLVAANTPVAAAVIKALRAVNHSALIFTPSTVDAEQLVASLGPLAAGVSVAQGVPNPYKAVTPIAREFQARIKSLGIDAARANFASLEGYIVARVVVEGLRRANKNPSRQDLVRGLESLQRLDLGGFVIDFGASQREGSRFVELSLIGSDGRIRQ